MWCIAKEKLICRFSKQIHRVRWYWILWITKLWFEINMSFLAGMLSSFNELFPNKTIISVNQEMKGKKTKKKQKKIFSKLFLPSYLTLLQYIHGYHPSNLQTREHIDMGPKADRFPASKATRKETFGVPMPIHAQCNLTKTVNSHCP